ncbi:hypothetical protein FB45DRAFT_297677 [Roridomyces roridus]|uniref:Uncharacterized protein n=1 Tax=Roridomyces roridus TaxID=1738132 RepID=A0AAD7CCC6_9AGAR|nr:hypothetical protein FB45DRAFT_297677 [Roridomyces roridus]
MSFDFSQIPTKLARLGEAIVREAQDQAQELQKNLEIVQAERDKLRGEYATLGIRFDNIRAEAEKNKSSSEAAERRILELQSHVSGLQSKLDVTEEKLCAKESEVRFLNEVRVQHHSRRPTDIFLTIKSHDSELCDRDEQIEVGLRRYKLI